MLSLKDKFSTMKRRGSAVSSEGSPRPNVAQIQQEGGSSPAFFTTSGENNNEDDIGNNGNSYGNVSLTVTSEADVLNTANNSPMIKRDSQLSTTVETTDNGSSSSSVLSYEEILVGAVREGDIESLSSILENISVAAMNDICGNNSHGGANNEPIVHLAARSPNSAETLQKLFSLPDDIKPIDFNVNKPNRYGRTALMETARNPDIFNILPSADILLRNGADGNQAFALHPLNYGNVYLHPQMNLSRVMMLEAAVVFHDLVQEGKNKRI